jgi:hypothetical protein
MLSGEKTPPDEEGQVKAICDEIDRRAQRSRSECRANIVGQGEIYFRRAQAETARVSSLK